jgi:hypothetical protein
VHAQLHRLLIREEPTTYPRPPSPQCAVLPDDMKSLVIQQCFGIGISLERVRGVACHIMSRLLECEGYAEISNYDALACAVIASTVLTHAPHVVCQHTGKALTNVMRAIKCNVLVSVW